MAPDPIITVGYDGSLSAQAGLRFALDEAKRQHANVELVCVYPPRSDLGDALGRLGSRPHEDAVDPQDQAHQILDDGTRLAAGLDPSAKLLLRPVAGWPTEVLLEAGARSALLVLGARQLSGLASFMLGSVSTSVVAQTRCPVAVMRGDRTLAPSDGIVVGVAPTAACQAVLEYAFAYAERHHAPMRAVLAYLPGFFAAPFSLGSTTHDQRRSAQLSEDLAGWREKFPDVVVEPVVAADFTSDALLKQAGGRHVLIIGSHATRPTLAGILGSTTQNLLHHAAAPVIVVPVRDASVGSSTG